MKTVAIFIDQLITSATIRLASVLISGLFHLPEAITHLEDEDDCNPRPGEQASPWLWPWPSWSCWIWSLHIEAAETPSIFGSAPGFPGATCVHPDVEQL
eukprot:s165_g18.t1